MSAFRHRQRPQRFHKASNHRAWTALPRMSCQRRRIPLSSVSSVIPVSLYRSLSPPDSANTAENPEEPAGEENRKGMKNRAAG